MNLFGIDFNFDTILLIIILILLLGQHFSKIKNFFTKKFDDKNGYFKIFLEYIYEIFIIFIPTILLFYLLLLNDQILDILKINNLTHSHSFYIILFIVGIFTIFYIFKNIHDKENVKIRIFMGGSIIIIFGLISSIILLKIFDYTNDKTNYCKNIFDKHKGYQKNLEEKINQINKNNKDNKDKINDLKKRLEYKIDMDKNFCGNFKYEDKDEEFKDIIKE